MKKKKQSPMGIEYRIVSFLKHPPVFCFSVEESRTLGIEHRMRVEKFTNFEEAITCYKRHMRGKVPEELQQYAITAVMERYASITPNVNIPPLW